MSQIPTMSNMLKNESIAGLMVKWYHADTVYSRRSYTQVVTWIPSIADVSSERIKYDQSVYQRARRLSASEKDDVNAQIRKWIEAGIARPSVSDYASPIVLVNPFASCVYLMCRVQTSAMFN